MSRRLRAFKRWMNSQNIEYAKNIEIIDKGINNGISIKANADLKQGDIVAKIPKNACLTIKTTACSEMIQDAGLAGSLGLAVALMYEKSIGECSLWAGYLQLLPERECGVPLVWTLDEVDQFLTGTELHKAVKDDKSLVYEDWKENILPLIASGPLELDPMAFGAEQYFAAKSLVSSRSFEIDDYHGFGMVPLADLFNHKTGAENVHFTSVSSPLSNTDNDSDAEDNEYINNHHYESTEHLSTCKNGSPAALGGKNISESNDIELSSNSEEDSDHLEMIIVKDVKAGDEVFNTYGSMGNAALLHRYGFTELDNPFDIINIELNMVLEWSSSLFSSRYSRARLSMWRRIGYCGCVSQNSEYFEISSDGEPQYELLILLYIIFLTDEVYDKLNQTVPSTGNLDKDVGILLLHKNTKRIPLEIPDMAKNYLLTDNVCGALVSLADIRESFYRLNSLRDDIQSLSSCCVRDRKLYHSMVLRVKERKILNNLRAYASSRSHKYKKRAVLRKNRR
ncbi:hypothetical protein IFM89_009900 [Coptis chinensis]|uniref:N-lysine methyltransferase n=1 Tax=Coptis chinensis TaxID=261450 RepID=A0A835I0Q8_9MAGN|nr:hypothetical protein IFM89_009900 [Coptis chinensis]